MQRGYAITHAQRQLALPLQREDRFIGLRRTGGWVDEAGHAHLVQPLEKGHQTGCLRLFAGPVDYGEQGVERTDMAVELAGGDAFFITFDPDTRGTAGSGLSSFSLSIPLVFSRA